MPDAQASEQYATADGMLALLGLLAGRVAPGERGSVDTLTHSLQAATRAERAGAGRPLVVAALCHDAGKVFSMRRHDRLSADLLSGYVPPDVVRVVRHHVDLTAQAWAAEDAAKRQRYRRASWYPAAVQFVDEWDVPSFDPDYPTEPLEHFEPALREQFARQRWPDPPRLPAQLVALRGALERCRRAVGVG